MKQALLASVVLFVIVSIGIFFHNITYKENQQTATIVEAHKKSTNSNKVEELYKTYEKFKKINNKQDSCSLRFDIPYGDEKFIFNTVSLPKYEILIRSNARDFSSRSSYYKIGNYWYKNTREPIYLSSSPRDPYYTSFDISLLTRGTNYKSKTIATVFIDKEKQTIDIKNDEEKINHREIVHMAINHMIIQCKNKL
jgi:hypothetical protein